ncbi:uncharacterized protein LOC111320341 [Stylophora pistillata]|uniref:uncharacterized protein LOC111320341 n=1 Tax=Stylophora pistillata TaxID=50429 RepID=UPI000C04EF90|nr:uncharacterized protein LOC111320341 [Stylophora pistillata]
MSEMTTIETKLRDSIGTGSARALRREGFIPAVLYGGEGAKPAHLAIDERIIIKGMHQERFMSKVLDIKVGSKTEKALARDVQLHPISDRPMHVDFMSVSKKSSVSVAVPLHFKNEAASPGLKRGAVLNIVQHEITLICPADSIPEHLSLDLTGLDVGDSLHVDALELPKGAKLANPDVDNTLATIVAPSSLRAKDQEETPKEEASSEEESSEEGESKE